MSIIDDILPWLPLFLILSSSLLFILKNNTKKKKKGRFPPRPPKLPIIGNLHQIGKLPHKSLWRLSQRYGPIFRLNLGRVETTIISSADAARALLKTHDLQCCTRPQTQSVKKLTHNFLDIAFSPYGDYWREIRKICTLELFSAKRVKSYEPVREEEVGAMIEFIAESASGSAVVDVSEKAMALTAGVVFRVAFGKRIEKGFGEVVSEAEGLMGSYSGIELFGWLGKICDWVCGREGKIDKVFHELNHLFQEVIDEHLNRDHKRDHSDHDDIIDVLLGIIEDSSSTSVPITHQNIKAILLNIFLAGLDTSSITIVWAMAELAKNPKLMKKAQQEIRTHIGIIPRRKLVTEMVAEEIPYLKMIVKETLRLHPPAPLLLPREIISHFQIDGYDFFPKTMVQVNAWAIGRDPKYWKGNPEEFDPERFSESSVDYRGQHFELLPFGAGRRICPGVSMGVKIVELALVNLLYHFDWMLPDGMKEEDLDMDEISGFSLTVYKKLPLLLVPVLHRP